MTRWLSAGCFFALLAACNNGYSARIDCRESIACCEELGEPVEGLSQDECETTSRDLFDLLTDEQQEALDDIAQFCRDRTGCAFETCITGVPPTSCPLVELQDGYAK
ncbi:MAG: hypothetical protein AAGA48_07730 [Myxococcota bacterium]